MITASTLALLGILLSFIGKIIAGVSSLLILLSSAAGNSNLFSFYRRGRPGDETEDATIDSLLRRMHVPERLLSRVAVAFRYLGILISFASIYAAYRQYLDPNTWTPFHLYGEDAGQNTPPPKPIVRDYPTSDDFAPKLVAKDVHDSVRLALELNPTAEGVKYLGNYPSISYSFDDGAWKSMFGGYSASPVEIDEKEALASKKIKFQFKIHGVMFGPFAYAVDASRTMLTSFKDHLNADSDWFSCSNGECFARAIAHFLPAVAAVRIGTSSTDFERYVQVPPFAPDDLWEFTFASQLPAIYVLPNVDSYMQLVYVDGTSSHVIAFRDQSSEGNLRGVLVPPIPAVSSNPQLLAAHDSNYQKWYLMPVQDHGKSIDGYATGDSPFRKVTSYSLGFWGNKALLLNETLVNGSVRFRFVDKDVPQVHTDVTYVFHEGAEANYATTSLAKDGSRLVQCTRFVDKDFIHEGRRTPLDVDAQAKIDFSRQASGYGFVHQAGVACIIPELSMSGSLTQADVSTISAVIFRGEPGRTLQESPVVETDGNINNEPVDYKRNYSHTNPVLPPETTEVFVRYRLKSGAVTGEYNIRIGSNGG